MRFSTAHFRRSLTLAGALAMALCSASLTAQTKITTLGASTSWYSGDTRNAAGTGLRGLLFTVPDYNGPGTGTTGYTSADDTAIAALISFGGYYAGSEGGVLRLFATDSNSGKADVKFYFSSPIPASPALANINATYRYYLDPQTTERTPALNFLILCSDSVIRSLSYVPEGMTGSGAGWKQPSLTATTTTTTPGTGLFLYGGGAPGGTLAQSMNAWLADATWGPLLSGGSILAHGFNLGSSQRNCYIGLDWLESSLIDGGARVNFDAPVSIGGEGYVSLAAAITAANPGDIIDIEPGNYSGPIVLSKPLTLRKSATPGTVTITAPSLDDAIRITATGSGSTIGGTAGRGLTIVGGNGPGGIERAAVYLQGAVTNVNISYNTIQANGDAGILSEFNAAVANLLISENTITGQTFVGAEPGGNGFATQFDAGNNVPRQLVTIGNPNGPATNVTFSNNLINGVAGGTNAGGEQGNTLVTIDAANAVITGNTFAGTTKRFAGSLRVRNANPTITGNTFDGTNLSTATNHVFVQLSTAAAVTNLFTAMAPANTFIGSALFSGPSGTGPFSGTIFNSVLTTDFQSGDAVTGLSGVTYSDFLLPRQGSGAHVAFLAILAGTGVTTSNDQAVVLSPNNAVPSVLAREGTLYGSQTPVSFSALVYTPAEVGLTASNSLNRPSHYTDQGGVAPRATSGAGSPAVASLRPLRLAADGTAAFGVNYTLGGAVTSTNDSATRFLSATGALVQEWREGSAAPASLPGVTLGQMVDSPAISSSGTAWIAALGAGSPPTTNGALFVGSATAPTVLARRGDAAPGTSDTFNGLSQVARTGVDVAFVSTLSGAIASNYGAWLSLNGAAPVLVARRGEQASGLPAGVTYRTLSGLAVADGADRVFTRMQLGGTVTASNSFAFYLLGSGADELVARQGDAAPGITGGTIASLGKAAVNSAGRVAFLVGLGGSASGSALYLKVPTVALGAPLLRTGGFYSPTNGPAKMITAITLDNGAPEDSGEPTVFTNDNRLSLVLTFSDSTKALVSFQL